MAPTIENLKLKIQLTGNYKNADSPLTAITSVNRSSESTYTTGTGSDKANTIVIVSATVSAGGTDTIDLAGSLTDIYGRTITFTEIKGFAVINNTTTAVSDTLEIGGNANPFVNWVKSGTDIVVVGPGSKMLIEDKKNGYGVTAATGDILDVKAPGGNNVDYEIWLWGEA